MKDDLKPEMTTSSGDLKVKKKLQLIFSFKSLILEPSYWTYTYAKQFLFVLHEYAILHIIGI